MTGKMIASIWVVLLSLTQFAAGQVSFKPAQTYSVGTTPVSAVVRDLNEDGIPDLVVGNQGSNNVSVLLGKGDGTLQAAVNYYAGVSANSIVIADINGDGKPDIAALVSGNASASSPGIVSILLGNGDGTFQAPIVLTLTPEQNPFTLVDVNGDKKADLIVNLTDATGNLLGVGVSLGNGDGTFQAANVVPNTSSVALVADLNKDNKPDLVLGNNPAQVMYGNGNGTFSVGPRAASPDEFVTRIWAADLNGDGQMDLIMDSASESGPSNNDVVEHIGVFLNSNNTFPNEQIFLAGGSFKPPFKPSVNCFITDIALGDFNGDEKLDVASRAQACGSNPPFAVNIGDGTGNFTVLPLTDPGSLAAAADLNGDQLSDLVVFDAAHNNIAVLLNSTPSFTVIPATSTLSTNAGQQVTDTLTVTSFNGFSSWLQLSCQVTGPTPLPACSVSPNDVTTGMTPATVTLTLAPSSSAVLISPMEKMHLQAPYAFALPLAFVGFCFRRRSLGSKRWLMIALLGVVSVLYAACGQGSANTQSVRDPKSYTVQVTTASAALTKNLQISLTVQ